jgi:hypothetical protein
MPFRAYQVRLLDVVEAVLNALESNAMPCFTLDGQSVLLEDALPLLPPSMAPRLKTLFEKNRLHMGPWHVMPDTVLSGFEALVRNLQRGMRHAAQWGCHQFTGYLPDSFGHPESIPTLLQGFGIDGALFWRGRRLKTPTGETKHPWFHWASLPQALGGPRVLAYQLPLGYFHMLWHEEDVSMEAKQQAWHTLIQQLQALPGPHWLPLGGDHLGPIALDTLEAMAPLLQSPAAEAIASALPSVAHPHQWHAAAKATLSLEEGLDSLPHHEGELREPGGEGAPFLLSGTLSSRLALKQANTQLEHTLALVLEPLIALVAYHSTTQPQFRLPQHTATLLDEAWHLLLLNHPHDSLCGCSVDAVHEANTVRFEEATTLAKSLLARLHHRLVQGLQQPPVLASNLCAWPMARVLPLTLSLPEGSDPHAFCQAHHLQYQSHSVVLKADYLHNVRQVPLSHLKQVQVQAWGHLSPTAALPPWSATALTWDTFSPVPASSQHTAAEEEKSPTSLENEHYKVWVEPATEGHWQWWVQDKATGRQWLNPLAPHAFEDQGDSYNSVPIAGTHQAFVLQEATVLHKGPWVGQLQLQWQLKGDATSPTTSPAETLTMVVELATESPYLGVQAHFTPQRPQYQWQMALSAPVGGPHQPLNGGVTYSSHLGVLQRPHTPPTWEHRWSGLPATGPEAEWEAEGGFTHGLLGTPHAHVVAPGFPAYEVVADTLLIPIHRGFGCISGGVLPSRTAPAGPPFPTPMGQGLHQPRHLAWAWCSQALTPSTTAKAYAQLHGLLGSVQVQGRPPTAPAEKPATTPQAKSWALPWPTNLASPIIPLSVQVTDFTATTPQWVYRLLNASSQPQVWPHPTATAGHAWQQVQLLNLKGDPLAPAEPLATAPAVVLAPHAVVTLAYS